METVIRAVQIEQRLLVIDALIVVMAKLMVDRHKVAGVDLGAHLDAQIILIVEVPGAGMADDFTIARLGDLGAGPEGVRQRRKTQ